MPEPARRLLAMGMTVAQARRALGERFRATGLDTPELDARLLIGHVLGLDQTGLVRQAQEAMSDADVHRLETLAARRLEREPVARIVGRKEFWDLSLHVTAATLVPRPETETVVEEALAAIDRDGTRAHALRIADLGTGTGALMLALLSELPNAYGFATDISRDAIAVARGNAERLGLAARAHFVVCDFGAALRGGFDLVVSNPPYVASADIATLAPEVRRDPARALDGGPDGLNGYRVIARQARSLIAREGHLVVELGLGQAQAAAAMFRQAGLSPTAVRADLAGIPRALHLHVATIRP